MHAEGNISFLQVGLMALFVVAIVIVGGSLIGWVYSLWGLAGLLTIGGGAGALVLAAWLLNR